MVSDDARGFEEYRDESEKTRDLVDDIIREMNIDSTYTGTTSVYRRSKEAVPQDFAKQPRRGYVDVQLDPWEVPEDYEDDAAFGFGISFMVKASATCDASTPPTNGAGRLHG